MKQLSNDYLNSIKNKSVLTISKCVKIKLKNDEIIAFTDYHKPIKFINDPDDCIYYPFGFVDTSHQSNINFTVNNLDITILMSETIGKDFLEKNYFNEASVLFFQFNFLLKPYSFSNIDIINDGYLGRIKKINNYKYEAEFLGKINRLKQTITHKLSPSCSNDFCDSMCKLNINDYKYDFTIIEVSNNKKEIILDNVYTENFFQHGYIKFLDGQSINEKHKIAYSNNNVLTLNTKIVGLYEIGDNINIFRGCANTPAACKTYNNYKNYNGFPNIPGQNYQISGKL